MASKTTDAAEAAVAAFLDAKESARRAHEERVSDSAYLRRTEDGKARSEYTRTLAVIFGSEKAIPYVYRKIGVNV